MGEVVGRVLRSLRALRLESTADGLENELIEGLREVFAVC